MSRAKRLKRKIIRFFFRKKAKLNFSLIIFGSVAEKLLILFARGCCRALSPGVLPCAKAIDANSIKTVVVIATLPSLPLMTRNAFPTIVKLAG